MNYAAARIIADLNARHGNLAQSQQEHGVDYHNVREYNRSLVLNLIRENGPVPRVEIARRTDLSRTTVSAIIDALLHEGFVREGESLDAAPSGGRRATLVHFNEGAGAILGVDIGRSHLTFLITNLYGVIQAHYSGPFDVTLGPEQCIPILITELKKFIAASNTPWEDFISIGVGVPSPLDSSAHKLISPPYMPGWDGTDVVAELSREFHIPVFLDNDANLGALGESKYGAGKNIHNFAYVKIGTGIGCGLIIDGNVYRGSSGSAGELGHVTIDPNGPKCGCGNYGCLESLASARVIIAESRLSQWFAEAPISGVSQKQLRSNEILNIADAIAAALAGDETSRKAFVRAGEYIGIALGGLINLFNPEVIILDGGVARAGALLIDAIARTAEARSVKTAWRKTHIIPGDLDKNAIALGAVAMVIDRAFGTLRLSAP